MKWKNQSVALDNRRVISVTPLTSFICVFSYLEFLLDDILVAPVLEQGATSRKIYFPQGTWRDETIKDADLIIGPTWKDYPASLDVLPYFTRITTSSSSTLSPSLFVILIVSLLIFYKYWADFSQLSLKFYFLNCKCWQNTGFLMWGDYKNWSRSR